MQSRILRCLAGSGLSPSFTLIHRDHYTTHLPFFRTVVRESYDVLEGRGQANTDETRDFATLTPEFKSNRAKRGETWQPLTRR